MAKKRGRQNDFAHPVEAPRGGGRVDDDDGSNVDLVIDDGSNVDFVIDVSGGVGRLGRVEGW